MSKKDKNQYADIKPTKFLKDGMVEYHSPTMHVRSSTMVAIQVCDRVNFVFCLAS